MKLLFVSQPRKDTIHQGITDRALERRWNDALAQMMELEKRLTAFGNQATELTNEERLRLFELGSDLQQLWDHPSASV